MLITDKTDKTDNTDNTNPNWHVLPPRADHNAIDQVVSHLRENIHSEAIFNT